MTQSVKFDYFDTKEATKKMLREYNDKKWFLENTGERISEIETSLYSAGGGSVVNVSSSAASESYHIEVSVDKVEALKYGFGKALGYESDITPALDRLTDDERYCLTCAFIDNADREGINRIIDRYQIEKTIAYKRVDLALSRLSKLLFW